MCTREVWAGNLDWREAGQVVGRMPRNNNNNEVVTEHASRISSNNNIRSGKRADQPMPDW